MVVATRTCTLPETLNRTAVRTDTGSAAAGDPFPCRLPQKIPPSIDFVSVKGQTVQHQSLTAAIHITARKTRNRPCSHRIGGFHPKIALPAITPTCWQ
ncbi:hypothetical protein MLPF_0998 [Mycobacterium lepromatosis]|nr:hypothetical protein MLPF_0998 [Mycobacterium lepromatosis]